MFTHVKREEGQNNLHISHLYSYVSAYCICPEETADLVEMLEHALTEAKKGRKTQYVDKDGEMFFEVCPSGLISLCIRWKSYTVIRDND